MVSWWTIHSPFAAASCPVLSKVDTNLRGVHALSTEFHSAIDGGGVCVLQMAKELAAVLATVKTHLTDFTAFIEEFQNHLLSRFAWKAANPHSPAALWLGGFRRSPIPVFANAIRRHRLVLCIVQTYGHSFHSGACELHGLVYSFCFEELHVAKLPVFQLVHSQTDHLNLSAALKEIDQVLLTGINGYVADPEGVAVLRFDAFWFVSAAAGGLCFPPGICRNLVHVGVVELDANTTELFTSLPHGPIDAVGVLELHMSEVAANHAVTQADLGDGSTILEEITEVCFFWLVLHPSDPNRPATIRLGSLLSSATTTPATTSIVLTASTRLPASTRATPTAPTASTTPARGRAAAAATARA